MRFQKRLVYYLTSILLGLGCGVDSSSTTETDFRAQDETIFLPTTSGENIMFAWLNQFRGTHGSPPLARSTLLDEVARLQSCVAVLGFIPWEEFEYHTDSAANRLARAQLADETGPGWHSENVYHGSSLAQAPRYAFDFFENSPVHFQNMNHDTYRTVGIGRGNAPGEFDEEFAWTIVFSSVELDDLEKEWRENLMILVDEVAPVAAPKRQDLMHCAFEPTQDPRPILQSKPSPATEHP